MSHREFYAIANITDLEDAFEWATQDARDEYGTHHPTGTIAEATDAVLVCDQPVPEAEALARAQELLAADDPRVRACDGPAAALALSGGELTRTIAFDRDTWHAAGARERDWHRPIAQAALDSRHPGEKVVRVLASRYQERRHPILNTTLPPLTGELDIITIGSGEHTGWLFFGRASD